MNDALHVPVLTPDQRVRVFVSSTLQELEQERRAVGQAISDLRLHPVMFEIGARPYPPAEVYRSYLKQSHIFVGIYWKSYGWVAPGMQMSGLEDEYRLSGSLPRLIYIKAAPEGRHPSLDGLLAHIRDEGCVCYRSFTTPNELAELVKNDIMLLISERFAIEVNQSVPPPSYLGALWERMKQTGFIPRNEIITAVEETLATTDRLALIGDPGVGKTFLLGMLGSRLNAVYISLKNKSTQQVFAYYANHLSLRRGRVLHSLPSEDEARTAFQQELANGNAVLIVDDADQNTEVSQALLSFYLYDCKMIFAVRTCEAGVLQGIRDFLVPPFDLDEIRGFLEARSLTLPPGQLIELQRHSGGNPLYLFYFTEQPVEPLPQNLEEYEQSLWVRLSMPQKEIMNYISLSLSPLKVSDIHWLLNSRGKVTIAPMETRELIDRAKPLVKDTQGVYEVFHPHFDDFVKKQITTDGLDSYYHSILGDYAVFRQRPVEAAFHLSHAGDSRAKDYRTGGARIAALQGQHALAEELLQYELREISTPGQEADVRLMLGQVYWELGRFSDANRETTRARDLYAKEGLEDQKGLSELWLSLLAIEEGKADEAIDSLTTALCTYGEHDELAKAILSVNLAYTFLQVSRLREAVELSRQALETFTGLGDEQGISACLTNLAAGLGQLGDRQTQRKYAEEVIARAEQLGNPRLKAAGLNLLGGALRSLDDLSGAQSALEECIRICQQLENTDLELLNICNLGNVFRDAHEDAKAQAAYTEALSRARSQGFPRHEARALELLAGVTFARKEYPEAVELSTEALKIHRQFGEHLRIASTLRDLGKCYQAMQRHEDAAESFEDAAHHYSVTGLLEDGTNSYSRASTIWGSIGRYDRADTCVQRAVHCAISSGDPRVAADVLEQVSTANQGGNLDSTFLKAIGLYTQHPDSPGLLNLALNFSAYCKRTQQPTLFTQGLTSIIESLRISAHPRLLSSLAILVEQSPGCLTDTKLDELTDEWVQSVPHMHFRSLPDGTLIWTFGFQWSRPLVVQITVPTTDPMAKVLAASLALVLLANDNYIKDIVQAMGGNQEDGFAIHLLVERDAKEHLGLEIPVPRIPDAAATISESNVPWGAEQPPTLLIVHEDYGRVADWNSNPGNKAYAWLLMNVFGTLVAHCTHGSKETLRRKSREFCEYVLMS